MTLGIRNNNPLNIRKVPGTHWKGELPSIQGGDGGGSFVRFETIEFGLRAAFVLLHTYATKYGANCIRDIISRWAPPSENDTDQYVRNVCKWTGFGGLQKLTESDWPSLVQAMGRQECGAVLPIETIMRGYYLYKINSQTHQLTNSSTHKLTLL